MGQFLLYPPIAFLIFLLIGYLIYRLSRALGPKPSMAEGKLSTYACGENIPGRKVQYSYHLFHFAFFFTVLHVATLVIATVPSGSIALVGIVYLLIALITVVILLTD
jgi:NADH-quinone oxidoreductase subunit A